MRCLIKKVRDFAAAFSGVLLFTGVLLAAQGGRAAKASQCQEGNGQPERPSSLLTHQETEDLENLVSQFVQWAPIWQRGAYTCDHPPHSVVWRVTQGTNDFAGKKVDFTLVRNELVVLAYSAPLQTYFRFPRVHDRGLDPALGEFTCENTYEDFDAHQRELADLVRKNTAGDLERAYKDPKIGPILEQMGKTMGPPRYAGKDVVENRTITIRIPSPHTVVARKDWPEEKKALLTEIVEASRIEFEKWCPPGKRGTARIPDFEAGDPGVFVLMEAPAYKEKCIAPFGFYRDKDTGRYGALSNRCDDYEDELKFYEPRITARQVARVSLLCPLKTAPKD